MTQGKNSGNGGNGNNRRRNHTCSFCGKGDRDTGPIIEGPDNTNICAGCVELCSSIIEQENRKKKAISTKFNAIPSPRSIKEMLDDYVIGQEKPKKRLSVAVHNHYKRLTIKDNGNSDVEIEKSNVLMVGPTGCGKTLLAKTLARFLDVPFAISDATTLTEAGYVGEDVENILLRLLQAADYDIELAQRGIIYIDEIDKIGKTNQNVSITRDVSGEGVQQSILKLLEGTIANIPPQGGRKHPEQQYIQMDTSQILFICGGTFSGLDNIIKKRLGRQKIGFGAEQLQQAVQGQDNILDKVTPEDLVHFGMIPELLGRLPIITALEPLDQQALIRIITEPKNALVRQYQKFFELEECQLDFTKDALEAIAQKALARDTGARAIRGVMEDIMIDIMYELPDKKNKQSYVIDQDIVNGQGQLFEPAKKTKKDKKEPA